MIETGGGKRQRHLNWVWDEQILAFDLFLRRGNLPANDPAVKDLSTLLKGLPIHPLSSRAPTFRNLNSVSRKLVDIQTHDPAYTGKATSGSRLDREVWEIYGARRDRVAILAEAIRTGSDVAAQREEDEEEIDDVHREGRVTYRVHRERERNRGLRAKKLKQMRERHGRLSCEACEGDLSRIYGELGDRVYECHHLEPLHVTGETINTIDDVVILCPTCHRVAHRIDPWPTLAELKSTVLPRSKR